MTNLFRNSSPHALTMQQAIALSKKRMSEHRRQLRQAQELAAQGRGEDTEIAHVARGEYVIPEALQTPEVLAALHRAAADYGVPLERLNVGNAMNSINPNTGAPEFGVMDWVSGLFQRNDSMPNLMSMHRASANYDFGLRGADVAGMTPEMKSHLTRYTNAPIEIGKSVRPFGPVDSFMRAFSAPARGVGEAIVNAGALFSDGGKQAKQRIDANNQRGQEEYDAGRVAAGRQGFDAPGFGGEFLGEYPLGRAFPKAATYGGATALGAVEGAIESALQPVEDPTAAYWQQKFDQIKKGAAQGAVEGRAKYLEGRAKDWFGF